MNDLMYCERCGEIRYFWFRKKCKRCGIKLKLFPEEMKQKYHIFDEKWMEAASILFNYSNMSVIGTLDGELKDREVLISYKNDFVMNELSHNPLFSMEEYQKLVDKERADNRIIAEYHQKEWGERVAKNCAQMQKENDRVNCIPKCPICGSTNIRKISLGGRAVKTAAFGIAGAVDDAGKTYKCENCDSKF